MMPGPGFISYMGRSFYSSTDWPPLDDESFGQSVKVKTLEDCSSKTKTYMQKLYDKGPVS